MTRLWLTECGHLTCSDHLEGGGMRHEKSPTRCILTVGRSTFPSRRPKAQGALPAMRLRKERLSASYAVRYY
jgi:hypothetical protein